MPGFEKALEFVLKHEGGFSDDEDDPGGATNLGITQRTYDAWRDKRGNPRQSVRHITHMEAAGIYRAEYWQKVRGDELPFPVAFAVFDFAVNAGVKEAIEVLQQEARTTADGVIGPRTLAVVGRTDPKQLALSICAGRVAFYHSLITKHPKLAKYINGWLNRVLALKAEIVGI